MDHYTKWVEKEQAWIEEIDRKTKAMIIKYCGLSFLGIEVALGALGLLAGGSVDIAGMLQNLLFGLIFGAFMIIFALCLMVRKPSKPYMKRLKAGAEALTPGEREEMASQMLSVFSLTEQPVTRWCGTYRSSRQRIINVLTR